MAYRSGWVTAHGVPIDQFDRHTDALAWSPDGTRLAILGWAAGVRVWHVAERELLFEHDEEVFKRQLWTPAGSEIVHLTPGGGDIVYHDGWTGEATRQLDMPFKRDPDTNTMISGSSVVWSPEGTLQAVATRQTQGTPYTIWDATTGEELYLLPLDAYSRLSAPLWSPDGTRMAIQTGDSPGFVLIWDVGANRLQHAIEAQFVREVAWSPDGRLLAGAYDFGGGGVLVWDTTTGALLTTLDGHRGPVDRVLWSADATRLISGSRDGTVVVWGVRAG
jgi:WD40 repeat protein